MSAYLIDTETTGQETGAECIELAIARLEHDLSFTPVFQGYFKPTQRIMFSAMAVHHILPAELEGSPDSALAKAQLPTDMQYMIGHGIDYDWEVLGKPICKRICTLAMSRKLWPGNDGHSLSALTYHLTQPEKLAEARETLQGAHGAGRDVELCYAALRAMLEEPAMKAVADSLEGLYQFSEEARIPEFWSFGKHKGEPIAGTDHGYLFWCLRQTEMDPYVKVAISRALGR